MKRIRVDEEYRRLLKLRITYEGNNQWMLKPVSTKQQTAISGKGELHFRGDTKAFSKYLMRLKAKDTESSPATARKKTYMQMAQEAYVGKDSYVWVWNNMWEPALRIQGV